MNLALLAAVGVVSFQTSLNRRMDSLVVVVVVAAAGLDQLLHLTRPIPFGQMYHLTGPFGLADCPIVAAAQAAALSREWHRTDCSLGSSSDCCPSLSWFGPFDQTGRIGFELVLVPVLKVHLETEVIQLQASPPN